MIVGFDALLKEDILSLGMRADEVRRAGPSGSRVWYQRVHVLRAADVRAPFTVPEAATEVRLLDTPETLEDALNLARAVKEAAGARVTTAFSLADLIDRSREGWGDLRSVLTQVAAAGIADVAELPVDLVDDLGAQVTLAREAGLLAQRLTVANALEGRKVEVLDRIRLCAAEARRGSAEARKPGSGMAITRVAPLPRNVPQGKPTTGYEDVRMVALARLALGHLSPPPFIEVDWQLYGPKLAQVALTFGADFLDAVPATSDESLGRRRATVEDVERNIRAAGFEPQEYRP